jgi:KUP system potassium uptake protein
VIAKLMGQRVHRNPGVAVYMAGQPKFAPTTLTLNLEHYSSLHEIILIVTVKTDEIPYVDVSKQALVKHMTQGFYKIELTYGFMDVPDVPNSLSMIKLHNNQFIDMAKVTYFLGQEHLIAKANGKGMSLWRERLFVYMSRNSQTASRFFNLPPEQVITVGVMVEL